MILNEMTHESSANLHPWSSWFMTRTEIEIDWNKNKNDYTSGHVLSVTKIGMEFAYERRKQGLDYFIGMESFHPS